MARSDLWGSCFGVAPTLGDLELLHGHGVGGTADGAQPAADAAVVVLDHGREREAASLGPLRERGALVVREVELQVGGQAVLGRQL